MTRTDWPTVTTMPSRCCVAKRLVARDGVAADRDRWRAVETFAVGDELALAASLLVADDDGGAGDGGAGCVGDGAADGSADDLRVRWRGGEYECCEDAGDGRMMR